LIRIPLLLLLPLAGAFPAGAGDSVELRRGPDAPSEVGAWFSALDRLLSGSSELSGALAASAAAPRARDGLGAASAVEGLAALSRKLGTSESELRPVVKAVAEVREALKGLGDDTPLPKGAVEKVYALDAPSLNRYSELMRQAALESAGPKGRFPANSLVSFKRGGTALEAAFLDVADTPHVRDGRVVSPPLWALLEARIGDAGEPPDTVLSGSRIWLRRGTADLFADFSAGGGGGTVRLRCLSPGGTTMEQARFYFLTRALFEAGFAVSVENGNLVALLSGERLKLDPAERVERFATAWKAFAASERMTPALMKEFLRGSVSQDDNAERLDRLARIFAAEGDLPFLAGTHVDRLRKGTDAYLADNSRREALRAEMDKVLIAWGFGGFPAGVPIGQRTIHLYYNGVLEAGLASGELKMSKERVVRGERYSPLEGLAAKLRGGLPPGAYSARRLAPVLARGRVLGRVGDYEAVQAQWRTDPDRWLLLRLLRHPDGSVRALEAFAAGPDAPLKSLKADAALGRLEELGVLPSAAAHASDTLPKGTQDRGAAAPAAFWALTLQPGPPVTARVTYDRARATQGDSIFLTPYVSAGDREAVRRCRALVTTAGGPQAAILAGISGIPALDLGQAEWSEGSGLRVEQTVFGPPKNYQGVVLRPAAQRRWLAVRDGDALRLDPERGLVEFLDPNKQEALVRLDGALKAYDRGADIQALAMWAKGQLTAPDMAPEERRQLGDALVSEMRSRLRTGIPKAHLERIMVVVEDSRR